MPPLTRWFIKASLIYFAVALLTGLGMALSEAVSLPDPLTTIFSVSGPVYFHLFLVGWVTQLIFGVAFWMFPKASLQKPRGNEKLGWATFWLLNVGLVLRVVGEPWQSLLPLSPAGWFLVLSAVLQWGAGAAFVINTWPRIKEK